MTDIKDAKRNEVIKSVILVLLGKEFTGRQSLQVELQKVVERETIRAVVGREPVEANYAAIGIILANMNLSQETVDFAVAKCLEIYERNKNNYLSIGVLDPLSAATKLISHGASKTVIEKVISAVAEQGWYGRIECLAKKFLGRGLTANEVKALVRSYVSDKVSRGEHTENELLRMARTYMSAEEAAEVQSQIRNFVIEFNRDY